MISMLEQKAQNHPASTYLFKTNYGNTNIMWNLFKVNYKDNRKAATDVIKFEEVNSGWVSEQLLWVSAAFT